MIYLDTSVALAHLLTEDWQPPDSLWQQPLVSSRLLQYELWTRLNARDLGESHGDVAQELLQRLALLELSKHCRRSVDKQALQAACRRRKNSISRLVSCRMSVLAVGR